MILDTNVLSEAMRLRAPVLAWLDRQPSGQIHLCSTVLAELMVGIERLPMGYRRAELAAAADLVIRNRCAADVLPFDDRAAIAYSRIASRAAASGRPIGFGDGQIAAIASVNGMVVVTRDVDPFRAAGIAVVNPYEEALD